VTAAQKMTDVSLYIFRSKFEKTRIQMIDDSIAKSPSMNVLNFEGIPREIYQLPGLCHCKSMKADAN
jgi:hypothetical protein